jgi:hypothetical protein
LKDDITTEQDTDTHSVALLGQIHEDYDEEEYEVTDEEGFYANVFSGRTSYVPTIPRDIDEKVDSTYDPSSRDPASSQSWFEPPYGESEPNFYHGMPFDKLSSAMIERAWFLSFTDCPASIACGPTIHFCLQELVKCPCFLDALPSDNVVRMRNRRTCESHAWHDHSTCQWCELHPQISSFWFKFFSGKSTIFPKIPNGLTLQEMDQDPCVNFKTSGLVPLPRENPPSTGVRLTLERPVRAPHRGSTRLFDAKCIRGCKSPVSRSRLIRGMDSAVLAELYGPGALPKPPLTRDVGDRTTISSRYVFSRDLVFAAKLLLYVMTFFLCMMIIITLLLLACVGYYFIRTMGVAHSGYLIS